MRTDRRIEWLRRERLISLGLAALAFGLALAQSPGRSTSDTKIGLHVDPVGFLVDVASAWSPTEDLGHVQGGQYGGYLFPMGPFFALGRLLDVAPWLVHRLWLGTVLALAAWGTLLLLDVLLGRPRGAGHVVAGLLVILNPYVVVFSARTSVTLLGYAALPWLLLCVHRGLRAPRSWSCPAAFALVVTCTGGGVNAAVTAWVLLGPVLLALYERWVGGVRLWGFAWRTAVLTGVASLWWVVPVLAQARHGVDFLQFTEQPGTIWSTSSLSESLRLMGYWISYLGVGYGGELRPLFSDGGVLLFALPVVLAGLLVPGLALAGFGWTRRWRYGAFFVGLVLAGLLVMAAGFPEGTPLRRALNFTYNNVEAVRFLRTSYKAGPLVAIGIACLAGALVVRTRWWVAGVLGALAVVAAWPLSTGRALDAQLLWDRVPESWSAAAAHVDRLPEGERAVVLPGQLYAYYDWGGTVDAILPALAGRPVAVRYAVPYADLRSVDLLWTLDALVQQRRALPGQLAPLLDLLGAGVVVAGADDDRRRSGAVPAGTAADVLDQLGPADHAWGPVRPEPRVASSLGGSRPLPRVRAWDLETSRPLVRVAPRDASMVVDGGADALAGLAALGALAPGGLAYAGDVGAAAVRSAGEVVISDSNRRRVFAAARMTQNHGHTLAADEPFSPDAAVLDPFPARGTDAQTVAVYDGVEALRAPFSPAYPQFPERRPFAAFDGDEATHWQADRALEPARHWLEVTFPSPRDVDAISLLPYSDRRGRVTAVEVEGRRFEVGRGWNRLRVGLRDARSLRVRIAGVVHPPGLGGSPGGPGGIRELRIPGLEVREALRPPVLAERALAGHDLDGTGLTYLFERTTGDDPFRRDPRRGPAGAGLVRDRLDGETGLARVFSPPAARSWTADGWASVAASAPDPALDRLAGIDGGFESSGRFEGRPGFRASSAFDGTPRPWIGSYQPGRPAWIAWETRRPATIRELRLTAPRERVRRPTRVRVTSAAAGGSSRAVPVAPDGTVRMPGPIRGRSFRLEVVEAAFPPGTPGVVRRRRAVGIGEIEVEGVSRVEVPRSGRLRGRCGDLAGTVGGRPLRLRPAGTLADLDAGRPLRVRSCGPVDLPDGRVRLELPAGVLAPYLLRLRSPAPLGTEPAAAPGRVVDGGEPGRSSRTGIGLELTRPARLVLGQAYSAAWRASCDGRELGAPQPVDGYAMAWDVPADCREADAWFGPDRTVRLGYAISAPVLVALLALLLLRRPSPRADAAPPDLPPPRTARMGAGRAAVVALAAGAVLAFVFALRTGPPIAVAAFLVLWRGVGPAPLIAAAGVLLLVAVPVLTLADPVPNRGGYNPEYALDRLPVHWVTVAAFVLLLLALARVLSTASGRRAAGRAGARPVSGPPARAP